MEKEYEIVSADLISSGKSCKIAEKIQIEEMGKLKKIGNIFFSRLVIVALAIILQFFWIFTVFYRLSVSFTFADVFFKIIALILSLYIINNMSNPNYKLAWTFIILVFPVLGITIYAVFGRSNLSKRTRERMDAVNREVTACLNVDREAEKELKEMDEGVANQSRYINDWASYPVYKNTKTKYYPSGEEMFVDMLEAVKHAEKFIFLEYFIVEEGKMFDAILEVLEQKVKEGITVRFIYDDVGCVNTLPPHFSRKLEEIGIPCAVFNPFRPILTIVMNNRDHRKILVVDGQIGFTGGINLADEYINEKERFGYWKDTGIKLCGEAVWSLSIMFLEMWNYIRNTSEDYKTFFPERYVYQPSPTDGYVQPYGDSPLDHENVGENIYLNIINHAKQYVYIFTPYLIVDHEMTVALSNAAKCGVDVRIVTPGIPDKKMIFLLTQSYYRQLLQSGVKIYEYTPGFIHAKCFVCDDKIATVGSINLDYRSLYLHFECGVFLYKSQAVMQVKEDADQTIGKSREITLEFCRNRNVLIRLIQSILRLVAPLL